MKYSSAASALSASLGEFGGSSVISVGDMVRSILPRNQLLSPLRMNSRGGSSVILVGDLVFCNVYYKHNVVQVVAAAFPDTSN